MWNKIVPLILTVFLSGCSLLQVQLDSKTVPLTPQELKMRSYTRDYAQLFFSEVETTADSLDAQLPVDDTVTQSYLLLWKIHAEQGMQKAAFQSYPAASLIDSWVFTEQMNNYFASLTPPSDNADVDWDQATKASQKLTDNINDVAKGIYNEDEYQASKEFVAAFAKDHPFDDISFARTPAYRQWIKAMNIDDISFNMGTMPEAIGDVSDRVSMSSELAPKIIGWKAQLIALNSNVQGEDLKEALHSLKASSDSFQDFVNNNPEYMQDLAQQMAVQLQPLVNDIDKKTDAKLDRLTNERVALASLVERERKELAIILSDQREALTQDLNATSEHIVNVVMDKVIELIKSTIIYFILFIVAIFFAPLGLGYMLGKRTQLKSMKNLSDQ